MDEPQNQTIDIQEELLKRYEALPQDLKDTMMSVETAEIIFEIGKKFGLNIEKTGKLAEEIGFVILGVIPSKDFVGNLKEILELDSEKALGIASEANHRIFLKIRDTLKELHGVRWIDQLAESPTVLPEKRMFEGIRPPIKPSEKMERDHKELPSILLEISPEGAKPQTAETQQEEEPEKGPVLTEITPEKEVGAEKIKTPVLLDTAHEIAAPQPGSHPKGEARSTGAAGQAPETLPIEQQAPQQTNESESSLHNKYLVDPYREPFE